jgi:hypothetical protein
MNFIGSYFLDLDLFKFLPFTSYYFGAAYIGLVIFLVFLVFNYLFY